MKLVAPPLIVDEKDGLKNDALDKSAYGDALLNPPSIINMMTGKSLLQCSRNN